jgi:hypothetical protein
MAARRQARLQNLHPRFQIRAARLVELKRISLVGGRGRDVVGRLDAYLAKWLNTRPSISLCVEKPR